MKKYILILIIPFLLNCSTFKKGKNTNNSTSIQQVIPSINDFNKADTNKDNVIDKNESIKLLVISLLFCILVIVCYLYLLLLTSSSAQPKGAKLRED